ncbi:MAG: DUF1844 domain-containing protein [Deltaproteobacteria bacterium]|jgi:hypothetical protein|nr:DUF1844 domain-containing protein [Deltaproteobacteria bacterium]
MSDDFVVNDRRAFTRDGALREDAGKEGAPAQDADGAEAATPPETGTGAGVGPPPETGKGEVPDARARADAEAKADAKARSRGRSGPGALPATFSTLIIGLATSAMMQMGDAELPGAAKPAEMDLEAAKHYIDILAELQRKTKGNLTPEEQNMLDTFLYDLRLRFVQLA